MNMWVNESGDNPESQGVEVFGIFRRSEVRNQSNSLDLSISNDDPARREIFNWTQDSTGVDDKNAITHARNPDGPELCEDCRHLR